ncbi:MAG: MFS transporter [Nitrospira sp.]|nr:MFS transporter [Nitrospira sp.]
MKLHECRSIGAQAEPIVPARAAMSARTGEAQWLLTRDFSLVWWSQIIAQVGDGVTKLALLWFVYSVTGSPMKTTVIGLLQTLPPVLLGPLFGVCVDRLSKKWIMIGSDVARALLIGVVPCMVSVESFTVERLYALVLLHAIASAAFGPAMTSAVPFLVGRSQLTAANAMLQTTTSLGVILGPALSGIGIASIGSQEVLCINAITYLGSAACLLPIHMSAEARVQHSRGAASSLVRDLVEGLRFSLVTQRRILVLILAASLYTFGTAAFSTLLPVFARNLLDLGPAEVGYLWSSFGAGLLAVSVGLVKVTDWELRKRFLMISASSALSGVAMWGLVMADEFRTAAVCMVLIGAGVGTLTPIAWGVLQEIAPGHMVGRVLAIYTTAAMTMAIGGMTVFGLITQRFGEVAGVIGIGFVMLATAVLATALSRFIHVRAAVRDRWATTTETKELCRRVSDRAA